MDLDNKIERWKTTAEIFLRDNIKAYVRDVAGNYYFCEVLLVGEDTLIVQCFDPPQRRGDKITLYWSLVEEFKQFEVRT